MTEYDMAELFRRDPLDLTDDEIDQGIITKFRASRGQFALGNMKAGKAPKAAAVAKGPKLGLKLDLATLLAAKKP